MTKTTKITTSIMLIAILSLMTTSLSYQPQEAYATVTSGVSTTTFQIITDPSDTTPDNPIDGIVGEDSQQDSTVFAFDEQTDLELPVDVNLDLSAMDGVTSVPAGTIVSSTTIVFDPPTTSLTHTQGCVEFVGQDVLGIQFASQTLIDSDPILGHPDVEYLGPELRGIEPNQNNDQVFFVGPKVCFILAASTPGDTFRVITVSDHVSTLLWQIGVFDASTEDLVRDELIETYDAGINPINNCNEIATDDCVDPHFPALMGTGSAANGNTEIDIEFELESECSDALFTYSRAGQEYSNILLDGVFQDQTQSAEFVYETFVIELGPLSVGEHVLTIQYLANDLTTDHLHGIDALALSCWEPAVPPTEIIEIDVKPGSDPSSWSCKNTKGSMPVAVFGSESFNVETIDLDSLVFTYDETFVPLEEVHDQIHIEDKNGDEYPDGVLHLDSSGVCDATADAPLKETVDVTLSGIFGEEQSFEGLGDIRIVNNGNSNDNEKGKDNNNGKGKGKP